MNRATSTTSAAAAAEKVDSKEVNSLETILQCRQAALDRWETLKKQAASRRALLEDSYRLQVFKKDERDMISWINEKMEFAIDESYKDPTNLQAQLRKQQAFDAELAAKQTEYANLRQMGKELVAANHYSADELQESLRHLEETWRHLHDKSNERGRKLEETLRLSQALEKFVNDFRDLMSWIRETSDQISSAELAKDVPGAEALVQRHQEMRSEIETRKGGISGALAFGENLVDTDHYAKDEISTNIRTLDDERTKLDELWKARRHEFLQCLELQKFERDASAAEKWTAARELFLSGCEDDLGDSLDTVEALQKKHDDFEKSLAAQEEKITSLTEFARRLVSDDHYASEHVQSVCDGVLERRRALVERSALRRVMLDQSYQKQCFDRDVDEVEAWIAEKMQIAADDSYRDPTNIQGKIQMQQAFESEVTANRSQVDRVAATAMELNESDHYAADHITQRLESLSENWDTLVASTKTKSERLTEALKGQQLKRAVDDVVAWIETVESQLETDEQGKDLPTVTALLKRHQLLEMNVTSYNERVEALLEEGNLLIEQDHFNKDEIEKHCHALLQRYEALSQPVAARHDVLQSSLVLQQYLRDAAGVEAWIHERIPIASSTDYGSHLTGVQSLQKKHQVFTTELTGHEQRVGAVGVTARTLCDDGHTASSQITERWEGLQRSWTSLKELSQMRAEKLDQSLQSQQYYADANEADSWVEDNRVQVASGGMGKDEDSTQNLIRRLGSTDSSVQQFEKDTLGQLREECNSMQTKSHFDAHNVSTRQEQLQAKLDDLKNLIRTRDRDLNFQLELHRFYREADTVEDWIGEQLSTANNEDLGRDVEHCQRVRDKFETFAQTLPNGKERVTSCVDAGNKLLDAESRDDIPLGDAVNPHPVVEATNEIRARQQQLADAWNELQTIVEERSAQLEGALQIHAFNRDIEEVLGRVTEKEGLLMTDDVGRDASSAEALMRRHETFERDLVALENRVEDITKNADLLSQVYEENAEGIAEQQATVIEAWEQLTASCSARKQRLNDSLELHRFLSDTRDLVSWMRDMHSLVGTNEPIRDVASAEAALKLHFDHKAEIEARSSKVTAVANFGKLLIERGHPANSQISEKLILLETEKVDLMKFWENRKVVLQWTLDLQQFDRDASLVDAWMTSRETFLSSDDVDENLAKVDDWLEKHENFEKALAAQEEKVKTLDEHAKKLLAGQGGWVN